MIHEAQQARVAVITADAGGMREYVRHEQNGLLFRGTMGLRRAVKRVYAGGSALQKRFAAAARQQVQRENNSSQLIETEAQIICRLMQRNNQA